MQKEHSQQLKLLTDYMESLGITVNIGKNKAGGNNGRFIQKKQGLRVDISKCAENPLNTVVHEFAHYVHSLYDKNLKSLNFVFGEVNNDIKEELIKVTVEAVPKDFASKLFDKKSEISTEIKSITGFIKTIYPDFKSSEQNKTIEKTIGMPYKYLLKYDKVSIFNKIISVQTIESDCPDLTPVQMAYIKLKSKKRLLARINSKISRLNRYYNEPTELFARFVEMYFTDYERARKLAPNVSELMKNLISKNSIKELNVLAEIFN